MKSPIDILIDRAAFQCTKCGARAGTCNCWTKCDCGWSFETGKKCRNPHHQFDAVGTAVAAAVEAAGSPFRISDAARRAIRQAAYSEGYGFAKAYHEADIEVANKTKGQDNG